MNEEQLKRIIRQAIFDIGVDPNQSHKIADAVYDALKAADAFSKDVD